MKKTELIEIIRKAIDNTENLKATPPIIDPEDMKEVMGVLIEGDYTRLGFSIKITDLSIKE